MSGWLRRNWWGLLAILPALALALVMPVREFQERLDQQPREAVTAAPGGTVRYSNAQLRLTALEAPAELQSAKGIPPRVKVWRAALQVDAADPQTALAGCRIVVEDGQGRTYDADPLELSNARLPSTQCTAASDSNVTGAYEARFHFVLPVDATAVALRLWVGTSLPAYARLTAA